MLLNRSLLFLLAFFIALSSAQAYFFNETWSNMYVEHDSLCPNIEVQFQVWNETDYEDRFDFDDSQKDEIYFRNISGATVKVYNGPIDLVPLLTETSTNGTGGFTITFPSENQYLLEIYPKDGERYNDYFEVIDILECEFSTITLNETNSTENETQENETSKSELDDQSFGYENNKYNLDLTQTSAQSASDIVVKEFATQEELEKEAYPVPNQFISAVEITTEHNLTTGTLTVRLDEGITLEKVVKYNDETNEWDDITLSSQNTEQVVFDSTELGVYALIGAITPSEEPVVEQTQTETAVEETTQEQSPASGLIDLLMPLSLGILLLIILGVGGYFSYTHMQKKKEEDENTSEVKSYNTIFEKTKTYISEYKNQYSKDQIYRALEGAHVPKDIIDKAFAELL